MEVSCLLTIGHDLGYIAADAPDDIRERIHHLSSRINKLRQSQLHRSNQGS